MITIIEGRACGHWPRVHGDNVIRIPARASRFVPHQLIRTALPVIRRVVAEPAFASLVSPSRAALSIVFAGLDGCLTEDDRRRAHALSSRLASHLTHNLPMQELLWDEYARFLLAAHLVAPLVIIIDELRDLDSCSFAVLLQLLRARADTSPEVIVGHTADPSARAAMDDRGILWDPGPADLSRMLGALRRLPFQVVPSGDPGRPCHCPIVRDPWDACPERRIEQLLARPPGTVDPAQAAGVVPALRRIFAAFAFDAALRLALAVLDAGVALSVADRSAVWGIAALSAHNRQFLSHGNDRIARFLQDAYCEALAHERDPELRIGLHYRLAVTHCRRRGDITGARCAIDAGLAELAGAELPALSRTLQEAWLRNIDALVQVRRGDLAAAFTCCEQAFHALAGVAAPDRVLAAELELSKLVIGENALTLASMTGDEALRQHWLARARDGLATWPSLTVVNLLERQRMHIDRLELVAAHELGVVALELARANLSLMLEYFILVSLSDLTFRLADPAAAAGYSDRARALAAEIGDVNGTRLALELRAAEIAAARGQLDEADQILCGLGAVGALEVDLQAEIWGRLAGVHARRGDREQALELIARTIDLTADSGELDLLLRASCHAGEVAGLLGMDDDARSAYEGCLELLSGGEVSSTAAREVLRLRAVLGLARLGHREPSQLARCLQRLPGLLARERDAWPPARELVRLRVFERLAGPELDAVVRAVSSVPAGSALEDPAAPAGQLGVASGDV